MNPIERPEPVDLLLARPRTKPPLDHCEFGSKIPRCGASTLDARQPIDRRPKTRQLATGRPPVGTVALGVRSCPHNPRPHLRPLAPTPRAPSPPPLPT